jgi:DNA-binding transcriptional regulator YhcF (GntR family)
MILEETILAKVQRLPARERRQLFEQIEQWIEQAMTTQALDIQRALAVVARTWATIQLNPKTLRWIAESKELEYAAD